MAKVGERAVVARTAAAATRPLMGEGDRRGLPFGGYSRGVMEDGPSCASRRAEVLDRTKEALFQAADRLEGPVASRWLQLQNLAGEGDQGQL